MKDLDQKRASTPEIEKVAAAYRNAGYLGDIHQSQEQMIRDHAQFINDLSKFGDFLYNKQIRSHSIKSKLTSLLKSSHNPENLLDSVRNAERNARDGRSPFEDGNFSHLQKAILKNNKAKIPPQVQGEFDRINAYLKKFTIVNEAYPQHKLNESLADKARPLLQKQFVQKHQFILRLELEKMKGMHENILNDYKLKKDNPSQRTEYETDAVLDHDIKRYTKFIGKLEKEIEKTRKGEPTIALEAGTAYKMLWSETDAEIKNEAIERAKVRAASEIIAKAKSEGQLQPPPKVSESAANHNPNPLFMFQRAVASQKAIEKSQRSSVSTNPLEMRPPTDDSQSRIKIGRRQSF